MRVLLETVVLIRHRSPILEHAGTTETINMGSMMAHSSLVAQTRRHFQTGQLANSAPMGSTKTGAYPIHRATEHDTKANAIPRV